MAGRDVLTHSYLGRGLLLVLSVCALVVSVVLLALMIGANDLTWGAWLYRLATAECFTILFLAGCAGVYWSIVAPPWMQAAVLRVGRFVAVCMLVPWPILLSLMLWPW